MKKTMLCLLAVSILMLLVCGCGEPEQNTFDPSYDLRFPDLEWGMTPEELCAALGLFEGDYVETVYEEDRTRYIADVHLDAFGVDAQVNFRFFDSNSDGEYCLYQVSLNYPADTDMKAVKTAVTEWYGEPTEQTDRDTVWHSKAIIQDYMSEEDKAMVELHGEMAQRMAQKPVTTITWTDCYSFRAVYDDRETQNVLSFSSEAAMYTREGGYAVLYSDE